MKPESTRSSELQHFPVLKAGYVRGEAVNGYAATQRWWPRLCCWEEELVAGNPCSLAKNLLPPTLSFLEAEKGIKNIVLAKKKWFERNHFLYQFFRTSLEKWNCTGSKRDDASEHRVIPVSLVFRPVQAVGSVKKCTVSNETRELSPSVSVIFLPSIIVLYILVFDQDCKGILAPWETMLDTHHKSLKVTNNHLKSLKCQLNRYVSVCAMFTQYQILVDPGGSWYPPHTLCEVGAPTRDRGHN